MAMARRSAVEKVLDKSNAAILEEWLRLQLDAGTMRRDLIDEKRLREQSKEFLTAFGQAISAHGLSDLSGEKWDVVRGSLEELSRERAEQGFSPSETAQFVFSLKEPLFRALQADGDDAAAVQGLWDLTSSLDTLGLYTTEHYQAGRESVIRRQQQELLELSTPVVELWDGVVAVPLIGTLDSERTQVVMEALLEAIVDKNATVAIVDITGVPAVDTLVAQHLIKTVSAARLMGADCIISGIRPQIAQTMVHLGIELENVATKASLAGAIELAFRRLGVQVVPRAG
jgi:rsbT co-antagonist protein RsbR